MFLKFVERESPMLAPSQRVLTIVTAISAGLEQALGLVIGLRLLPLKETCRLKWPAEDVVPLCR